MQTRQLNGWLNVLKPPGMTSHDVVVWLRRQLTRLGATKVGHTGTLDPGAAGVMPLCVGKAARLAQFVSDCHKTYVFEITFGIATDTLDADGKVIACTDTKIELAALKEILPEFVGEIEQTPPSFSAVHINGVKAYKLAQQGQEVEIPARKITIYELGLLKYKTQPVQKALLRTVCSKGTYIRTLCADIGARLGSAAHVSFLIREAVGPFRLEEALTLQELQEDFAAPLLPLDYPLAHLPAVRITPEQAAKFCSGSALEGIPRSQQESIRVYVDEKNELIGIGRFDNALLAPAVVLSSAQEFSC